MSFVAARTRNPTHRCATMCADHAFNRRRVQRTQPGEIQRRRRGLRRGRGDGCPLLCGALPDLRSGCVRAPERAGGGQPRPAGRHLRLGPHSGVLRGCGTHRHARRPRSVPAPFSPVVREAVSHARSLSYEGVPVRVVAPEYLVVLALQSGGARRRERAWQLLESGEVDRDELRRLCIRHGVNVEIPDDV